MGQDLACKDGVCRTQWAHQLPQCVPVFRVLLLLFSVKIWDKTWHVKMVFVGHSGPINSRRVPVFRVLRFLFSVKIWDKTWHVKMVFVGHSGPINSLGVYPSLEFYCYYFQLRSGTRPGM